MLPSEDLLVYVYVLIDDLMTARIIVIPPRPGPAPGCGDAELLTIATMRHVLGRRSEAGSWPRWTATGRCHSGGGATLCRLLLSPAWRPLPSSCCSCR